MKIKMQILIPKSWKIMSRQKRETQKGGCAIWNNFLREITLKIQIDHFLRIEKRKTNIGMRNFD